MSHGFAMAILLATGAAGAAGATEAPPSAGSRAVLIAGGIENSDYPVEALAQKQEGTVAARFNIDTQGRTSRCAIVESSGSVQLDGRTCGIIEERFRYRPARNAEGGATDEWRTQKIAWRLPDLNEQAEPPAVDPVRGEFLLEIGADGTVESCRVRTSSGDSKWDDAQCRAVGQSAQFKPKVGPDGRKVRSLHLWRVR